jgi:tRNA-intron endonuclease
MRAELSDEIVTIKIPEGSKRAIALNQKSAFGKLEDDVLELSLIEAFYLMESGRLDIYKAKQDKEDKEDKKDKKDKKDGNEGDKKENKHNGEEQKLEPNHIRDIIKSKGSYGKYIVYRDLKDRGYIIKTGFKYGSEFRLYTRGKAPGKGHSDYLVKVIYETHNISILDFSSYVRVAHGVNKNLLLAVVDDEEDITYYNVEWTKP